MKRSQRTQPLLAPKKKERAQSAGTITKGRRRPTTNGFSKSLRSKRVCPQRCHRRSTSFRHRHRTCSLSVNVYVLKKSCATLIANVTGEGTWASLCSRVLLFFHNQWDPHQGRALGLPNRLRGFFLIFRQGNSKEDLNERSPRSPEGKNVLCYLFGDIYLYACISLSPPLFFPTPTHAYLRSFGTKVEPQVASGAYGWGPGAGFGWSRQMYSTCYMFRMDSP